MTRKLQHVLCVDDEADILEVAEMSLATVGDFTVTCLHSGAEAVAKAETIAPDIILLDVMMPEMDGTATLKALQQNPALASVPVVFMTARVQTADVTRYLQQGAIGVIAKPFDPMLLSAQLTELWENYHAR
jgi:two-component system OmpR family response regulator